MSDVSVTKVKILGIEPHPNADRLEIATILGTQTIVPRGEYFVGEAVFYFPPDLLLSPRLAEDLGVTQYLRYAIWDGTKCQCRVAAARLRGVPSYGFVAKLLPTWLRLDNDTGETIRNHTAKYQPPERIRLSGDALSPISEFPIYTDIQHYWRYPYIIEEGTYVRVLEKVHGANFRMALIKQVDGPPLLTCGSHRCRLKEIDEKGRGSTFWRPLNFCAGIMDYCLDTYDANVVVFGEIYGPEVQYMDYGVKPGEIGFVIFDIAVKGQFLSWFELTSIPGIASCLPPLIYWGPFNKNKVTEWTNGPTLISNQVASKFKGREGVVITPVADRFHADIGRVVLKSVSVDYLNRKGA